MTKYLSGPCWCQERNRARVPSQNRQDGFRGRGRSAISAFAAKEIATPRHKEETESGAERHHQGTRRKRKSEIRNWLLGCLVPWDLFRISSFEIRVLPTAVSLCLCVEFACLVCALHAKARVLPGTAAQNRFPCLGTAGRVRTRRETEETMSVSARRKQTECCRHFGVVRGALGVMRRVSCVFALTSALPRLQSVKAG
jgi:hypothetical protein